MTDQERDSPATSSSSKDAPKTRRPPHSSAAWAKIRPTLQYYYITMDMTLEDAMQKILKEHNFYATDNMYKKRLKAWGLTKHIKATEKEKALARILQNGSCTGDRIPIRHDKLVRYAKARAKSGALDTDHLRKITRQKTSVIDVPHSGVPVNIAARTSIVPDSIIPHDQVAKLDVFLRALQVVVERERKEYLMGPQDPPFAIFTSLNKGLSLWRDNAFAAARKSFGEAAQMTIEDLRGAEVSVSRIAFCISSIVWGSQREPVFLKFAEFMLNAALEILGPRSPMTMILRHLQTEQSVEAQVRIWAATCDGYEVSEQNFEHWWNMWQRRWRWLMGSGKLELAAQCCRHAVREARRINRLTVDMVMEAERDVETIVSRVHEV